MIGQIDNDIDGYPNGVEMLESPYHTKTSKAISTLFVENKYRSLIYVLSNMSLDELVGGLCSYIKSINSIDILE